MSRPRSRLAVTAALLVVVGMTVAWSPAPSETVGRATAAGHISVDRPPTDSAAQRPASDPVPHGSVQAQRGGGAGAALAASTTSEPSWGGSIAQAYSGRNRFWIPELGVSRPVVPYACNRRRAPDNYIYRWGCAGANNVYILGHAQGVMKPLHDAYAHGRLHVGMIALYADGAGRIRAYRVTEWRVVDPVNSNWALRTQAVPSMTLQTCVGPQGRLRLNVRLVAVD